MLAGARAAHPGGNNRQGAAYVFTRSGTTWTQDAKLTASDGTSFDQLATSVGLGGDTAVLGSRKPVGGHSAQGAAYAFTRLGTAFWSDMADGPIGGGSVASGTGSSTLGLSNVQAPQTVRCRVGNDCGTVNSDAADLRIKTADFNGNGVRSVQDIFDFLAAYFSHDPRADFNASGVISVQDIFDFLAAYFSGC
jgi:hypothetical protein